jgi:hypothetical protein
MRTPPIMGICAFPIAKYRYFFFAKGVGSDKLPRIFTVVNTRSLSTRSVEHHFDGRLLGLVS